MGFFNNMKNLKDQALENEKIQNYEQLQGLFDAIDNQAEKEKEKDKKEREYFESLTPEQKVEYKRIKKRNKNLKKLRNVWFNCRKHGYWCWCSCYDGC